MIIFNNWPDRPPMMRTFSRLPEQNQRQTRGRKTMNASAISPSPDIKIQLNESKHKSISLGGSYGWTPWLLAVRVIDSQHDQPRVEVIGHVLPRHWHRMDAAEVALAL